MLLLDEPLGALDLKLRHEMQAELKRIQREVGITFVFVTHDQDEALTMSDRVAVFNAGDAVVAFPMAFYMARIARPRTRKLLVVAVLTPLWAGYLVKVYAWRVIFSQGGVLDRLGAPFGLASPGYGTAAVIAVLAYLWLPYMILPVYAGLENLPANLLDASADLGASAGRTLRSVVLPLIRPAPCWLAGCWRSRSPSTRSW